MGARLTDSELAARVRDANQRRAARLLERQKAAGRVALTIWVNATTKARVDEARHGASLNETAERLLLAGLNATMPAATTTPAPEAATMDMFPAPATSHESSAKKDALMNEVARLLNEGHNGNEIARQLNASGQRTASGAAFTGQNILRDYRAWARKNGAASEPQPT